MLHSCNTFAKMTLMRNESVHFQSNFRRLYINLDPFARDETLDRIESILEILMVSRSGSGGYYERLETPWSWYSETWINYDLLASRPEAYPAFVDSDHPRRDGNYLDQDNPHSAYPVGMSQLITCLHSGPAPARGSPALRRQHINH